MTAAWVRDATKVTAAPSNRNRADRIANLLLVSGAAASFAVAWLLWIRLQGSSWSATTILPVGVPTLLGIGLLAAVRLDLIRKLGLLAVLVAVTLSVYAMEAVVSVLPLPTRLEIHQAAAERSGREFDDRPPTQVIRELRARGDTVFPVVYGWIGLSLQAARSDARGGFILLAPGISNVLTLFCNEVGTFVSYRSDEHGFRNPSGLWRGPIDVAVVGDSFAHGMCVPSDSTIDGHLRKTIASTLNLGLSGTGPLAQLAVMREYLPAVRPSVVLWLYYEDNDLIDAYDEIQRPELTAYLSQGYRQNLMERQHEVDLRVSKIIEEELAGAKSSPVPTTRKLRFTSSASEIIRLTNLRSRLGILSFPPPLDRIELYRRIVEEALITVHSLGGHLWVVYLPAYRRFARGTDAGDELLRRGRVLDLLAELGVPVIDVSALFRRFPNPQIFWYNPASHYTSEANERIAHAIRDTIAAASQLRNRDHPRMQK